jgi:hypothetical protein
MREGAWWCGLGAFGVFSLLAAGCWTAGEDASVESAGSVALEIQKVPSDIRCIQITGAGSRVQTKSFDVTPLGNTTLIMPGIAPGSVTFSGASYPLACKLVTAASAPTWVADPVTATIVAGTQTNLSIVMRPSGSGGITIDFQGGANDGVPLGLWDSMNWDNAIWQ